MKAYHYRDGVFEFAGAVSVESNADWVAPWRIQVDQSKLYPFLIDKAAQACSGIRVTFATTSENVSLFIEPCSEAICLDLCVEGLFVETIQVEANTEEVTFAPLTPGKKLVEIWLDPRYPLRLRAVAIDSDADITKEERNKPRWVHYGSSISHASTGRTPTKIWPALVANRAELHLTNLGFGGNCVFEPMIGRLIRDLPADFISLKLGINVHRGALTQRTFAPNVIGLIALIREKHPHIPLAIISPIICPPRESERFHQQSLTLCEMRSILADVVATFQQYGDRNIHYVNGLSIFGTNDLQYLPDELHPDAEGQFVVADNFTQHVVREIFSKP